MFSNLLSTNVLCIKVYNDFIFAGIGCNLHIFKISTNACIKKMQCLYPDNIHGIEFDPYKQCMAVFGNKHISIYRINKTNNNVLFKKYLEEMLFNEWIIDAKWLPLEESIRLLILFAPNYVIIYDVDHLRCINTVYCENKCVLYSGSILKNCDDDYIIFSGTVFKEILIWRINPHKNYNDSVPILHCLEGHRGVIFSISFDPNNNLICSTSDDRTVRLWKIRNTIRNCEKCSQCIKWDKVIIEMVHIMYGHSARIWKGVFVNNKVLSIGEDSSLCVWSLEGSLLHKIQAHFGAAIWSIDTSSNPEFIVTGGADGSIHKWFLYYSIPKLLPLNLKKNELITHVGFLKHGSVLLMKNDSLFSYNQDKLTLEDGNILRSNKKLCMKISPNRTLVALTSKCNLIKIYSENESTGPQKLKIICEKEIMCKRIYFLDWLDNELIVVSCTENLVKIFKLCENELYVHSIYILSTNNQTNWLNAASIYEQLFVCGDKNGNMQYFKLYNIREVDFKTTHLKYPVQSYNKIHGSSGIQCFTVLNKQLMTAGRDGNIRFYLKYKKEETEKLQFLYACKMPMEWICGTIKTDTDVFILGFKEAQIIIFSFSLQKVIAREKCGGGHRPWDCVLINNLLYLIYIRSKKIIVSEYDLNKLIQPAVKNGFHKKETCCIQRIRKNNNCLLISGSEDCSLRITRITEKEYDEKDFKTLAILNGHISNIKAISVIHLDDKKQYSKYLIVSGGGRAQLKIWQLKFRSATTELTEANIICRDILSHMLYGTDQERRKLMHKTKSNYSVDAETRYMDITTCFSEDREWLFIFIACGDGCLRIFFYNLIDNTVGLRLIFKCTNCILKVHLLKWFNERILLTMDSKGFIKFWYLTNLLKEKLNSTDVSSENIDLSPITVLRTHQSGINTFDIRRITKKNYLLATGGDDNLLSIVPFEILMLNDNICINVLSRWNSSWMHTTQITGIKFCGKFRLISVGLDQCVILHKYFLRDYCIHSVEPIKRMITCVSDVQGVTLCSRKSSRRIVLCVYGKGFEIITCGKI